MSCRELVEAITDYLEGTMGADDRARFEAHLELCPFCVTYLEQMRQTIATVGELREESIAPETRDELLGAFRGWQAAR
ncbi:MAG: anti-sigma factor [Thermoleophilaceae bacterium]